MKITFISLLLTGLLLSISFKSQSQITSLKFQTYHHQIYIKVRLNNLPDTLNFIFDSGASGCVLDSAVAARVFKESELGQSQATDVAGKTNVKSIENQSISINNLQLDSLNFVIKDLSILSTGMQVDGIIGYDIIKKYVMQIDFDTEMISIFNKIREVKSVKGTPLHFEFSKEASYLPKIEASFKTQSGKVFSGYYFLDSGASLVALLNTPFVNENNLVSSMGKTFSISSQGLSNKVNKFKARIPEFNLGSFKFFDLPIDMAQSQGGVSGLEGYCGILGNVILFRFNLIFDYENKTIYLKPNHLYNEKFEFPTCAFSITAVNRNIVISNVSPGSPEATQGLSKGDIILAVNGKSNLGLGVIKDILNQPGKITLFIKKEDGKEVSYQIALYSRI